MSAACLKLAQGQKDVRERIGYCIGALLPQTGASFGALLMFQLVQALGADLDVETTWVLIPWVATGGTAVNRRSHGASQAPISEQLQQRIPCADTGCCILLVATVGLQCDQPRTRSAGGRCSGAQTRPFRFCTVRLRPGRERWIDFLYSMTSTEGTPWMRGLPPKEARRQLDELAVGTVSVIWYRGYRRRERLRGRLSIETDRVHFRESQVNPIVFTCDHPVAHIGAICHRSDARVNGGWNDASRWLYLSCGDTTVDLVVSELQSRHIARAINVSPSPEDPTVRSRSESD